MITGSIYNIMIGCPSDVTEIAERAIQVIHNWNIIHSNDKCIALVPHHWTSSSYPSMIGSAQSVLNYQLVDKSDALIAIFGCRLGAPTNEHISGTVEEIEKHRKAGKPVMIFFANSVPFDCDFQQLQKLKEYKNSITGLYDTFDNSEDFEKKFISKLELFAQNELATIKEAVEYQDKQKKTVSFSAEEVEIMEKWCASKVDRCSQMAFMGGNHIFKFGSHQVITEGPKETAKYTDFLKRLEAAGLIEFVEYTNQHLPEYKLTYKAYENFS